MNTNLNSLVAGVFLIAASAGVGQSVITTQRQNQTNIAGTTATFTVTTIAAPPLAYRWQRDTGHLDFSDLADATKSTLVLTNVGASDGVDYRVLVATGAGAVTSAVATLTVILPPQITSLTNLYPSTSLGGRQALSVSATGTPLNFQWFRNGVDLASQAGYRQPANVLDFASVQLTNLGIYTVVVSNASGSVTSNPVRLDVDPTFTKITTGAIVTDRAFAWGGAWGDYDNDGFIDLVVGVQGLNLLYHNNGDGTFTRITNSPIATQVGNSIVTWGDYDNDGALDLFDSEWDYTDRLYHNSGNGTFTNVTNIAPTQEGKSNVAAWGDYDRDGFLDLAVVNVSSPNRLYHNNGDGTFAKMNTNQAGIMVAKLPGTLVSSCLWGDYDDDGYLDMLFTVDDGHSVLVHNNGDGTFTQVTNTPISALVGHSGSSVWADFFNSGRLDLFDANGGDLEAEDAWFFRNDGRGVFARLSATDVGPVVPNKSQGFACAAADFDNDGYLDLFVSNYGGQGNFLFHNNGDGTFSRVNTGSLVHDRAISTGCAWGDYDNDGFMDLYVANGGWVGAQAGFLYRNSAKDNGNTNHWLKLKLVGTTSNRSAIGAKVRLQATIWGKPFWQRRDVSGGGVPGQDDLRPNFGLGDATNAQTVRIEWPSGIVQELRNVAANQILTVTEPVRLEVTGPGQFEWRGWKGQSFVVEGSTNLVDWSSLASVTARTSSSTNSLGIARFGDPDAPASTARFYRVRPQQFPRF